MIATWMLYCMLSTLWMAIAAAAVERTLLRSAKRLRLIWVVSLALSATVPALTYVRGRRAALPAPLALHVAVPVGAARVPPDAATPTVLTAKSAAPVSERESRSWSAILMRADQPLTAIWLASSVFVLLYIAAGVGRLFRVRRSWQWSEVLDRAVLVSADTGPALVGIISPAIVVPVWALSLDPVQLDLLLRHEEEHRRSHDGRLLMGAQLLLVTMPWNPALWWQVARLRAAIELDCDARVMRGADPRSYGNLLLEVARPGRAQRLVGATALLEQATQLERRIRLLTRPVGQTTRRRMALTGMIGAFALVVAGLTPRPPSASGIGPLPAQLSGDIALAPLDSTPQVRSIDTLGPATRAWLRSAIGRYFPTLLTGDSSIRSVTLFVNDHGALVSVAGRGHLSAANSLPVPGLSDSAAFQFDFAPSGTGGAADDAVLDSTLPANWNHIRDSLLSQIRNQIGQGHSAYGLDAGDSGNVGARSAEARHQVPTFGDGVGHANYTTREYDPPGHLIAIGGLIPAGPVLDFGSHLPDPGPLRRGSLGVHIVFPSEFFYQRMPGPSSEDPYAGLDAHSFMWDDELDIPAGVIGPAVLHVHVIMLKP